MPTAQVSPKQPHKIIEFFEDPPELLLSSEEASHVFFLFTFLKNVKFEPYFIFGSCSVKLAASPLPGHHFACFIAC